MRRATIAVVLVLLVVAAAIVGGVALFRSYRSHVDARCDFGAFTTDTGQAAVAATMVGVVVTRQLPARAAVLVIAAGLQESKLRNIPAGQGDRDSVGVLQQRPSQGWGTEQQLADVQYATGAFLDHLVKVPDWETLPLATAIQEVQISADGDAYAKHEQRAQAIANGLNGSAQRAISCQFAAPTKVADASHVASSVAATLPINAPQVSGRTISVHGASWATVGWFIANADQLGIDSVAYSGGRWQRSVGWRDDAQASGDAVTAQMHA